MFNDTYCMDESNVYTTWKYVCEKNDDVIRVGWYEGYICRWVTNKGEGNEIIECLCSE